MFYPKIKTLYTRDNRFKVLASSQFYNAPVFGNITKWLLTEKIDGCNVSIKVERDPLDRRDTHVTVRGRTAKAQPEQFMQAIENMRLPLGSTYLSPTSDFERSVHSRLRSVMDERGLDSIELFGEAYGPGIQSGGFYGPQQEFIVYDIRVDGTLWLPWAGVEKTAGECRIPTVPVVNHAATIPFARHLVSRGFSSSLTSDERPCEGVVARPATGELYDNGGNRIAWKLKHSDF